MKRTASQAFNAAAPRGLVDRKSGNLKKFETVFDRLRGEYPPLAAHYSVLAFKAALLAPFIGGMAVAAPLALGVTVAGVVAIGAFMEKLHTKILVEGDYPGYRRFDLTKPEDAALFNHHFAAKNPSFVADYLRLVEMAGVAAAPRVLIKTQENASGPRIFGKRAPDYTVGIATSPSGKNPVMILGRSAFDELTPAEMRAVVGHELTHAKLGHMQKAMRWRGVAPLNSLLNLGLLGAAVFGPLAVVPTLALVLTTNVIGHCLNLMQARHHERLCDRGAALLTGGTADLKSALDKIQKGMQRDIEQRRAARALKRGKKPQAYRQPGALRRFFTARHPSVPERHVLLEAFGTKYAAFCEGRRNLFTGAFNATAANNNQPAAPQKAADPASVVTPGLKG